MRPTTALNDNVVDLNAFLHPGTAFESPRDVVSQRQRVALMRQRRARRQRSTARQ